MAPCNNSFMVIVGGLHFATSEKSIVKPSYKNAMSACISTYYKGSLVRNFRNYEQLDSSVNR